MSNCYECKFRRPVSGSAHSSCGVLKTLFEPSITSSDILIMESLLASGTAKLKSELVEIDPVGAKNGWATWPINFDPVWIKCTLFLHRDDDKND